MAVDGLHMARGASAFERGRFGNQSARPARFSWL